VSFGGVTRRPDHDGHEVSLPEGTLVLITSADAVLPGVRMR